MKHCVFFTWRRKTEIYGLLMSFKLLHKQYVSEKIYFKDVLWFLLKYNTTKCNWKHSYSKEKRAGQVTLSFLDFMIPYLLSFFVFKYHDNL